jgi:alkanesulfonate monooxygenase SsuD/methylene tetrahydromethanopterin reductase-like flavin-dependent oxidoreductase (luciferase family)
MRFGLMTEPQLGMTYAELADAARFAESIGLDVFARSDHFAFPGFEAPHATEAFATLGGLAGETERIGLCVLVSPITFRHPGVIAKSAATLHEMSGGRMILGVGTGWMEHEHDLLGIPFPDVAERFDRFEEALAYLHAALGRSGGGFRGEHYAVEDAEFHPTAPGMRLVVGGSGPQRTPRLAGTYADEYNTAFLPADELAVRIERVRNAAEAAGRDPGELLISVMGGAVVGRDEASFRRNVERIAAVHPMGRTPEQLEEGMRKRGLPVGTPAEARQALGAYADVGVELFYVQHLGPFDHDLVEETFDVLRS